MFINSRVARALDWEPSSSYFHSDTYPTTPTSEPLLWREMTRMEDCRDVVFISLLEVNVFGRSCYCDVVFVVMVS
jgi:hypothetical protein